MQSFEYSSSFLQFFLFLLSSLFSAGLFYSIPIQFNCVNEEWMKIQFFFFISPGAHVSCGIHAFHFFFSSHLSSIGCLALCQLYNSEIYNICGASINVCECHKIHSNEHHLLSINRWMSHYDEWQKKKTKMMKITCICLISHSNIIFPFSR